MSLQLDLAAERDRLKAWLAGQVFPTWWKQGADHEDGGFHDRLNAAGRLLAGVKRCRVQARQVFCYGIAPAMGWEGPWRAAMDHGRAVLEDRFRRPDGLYRALFTPGAADDAVDLYDQAFVLLADACLAARGDVVAAAPRAQALLDRLPVDPTGGFAEFDGASLHANPNMYLFEAFLAWAEVTGEEPWREAAAGQARLALTRLIDPRTGAVSETFGPEWAPLETGARRVEPGHQFEWAWLMMRWSLISGDAGALAAALRLVEIGERAGVDSERNVAVNALDGELNLVDAGTRLWPQTERLRAHLLAGAVTGNETCWENALRAVRGLGPFLEVETPGLWRDSLESEDMSAPASSLYHLVGAIAQLDQMVAGRTWGRMV
jgi:mannose/cellobiose epimerase-like protein (N-acyl-D-glucosamine 2-epimerase family)